jgi:putative transposase
MQKRKRYEAGFKTRVAIEAIKGEKTLSEPAGRFGIHPNQITMWKKQAIESLPEIFSKRRSKKRKDEDDLTSELYRQIGQLKVELDWLKKKSGLTG